jgi:hypothetical protein
MADRRQWIIGAQPDCDIIIDQPTVSSRHCRLSLRDGDFYLEDLASTNGTFVNGTRIEKSRTVSPQDRITLGQAISMPWPTPSPPPSHKSPKPADSNVARRTDVLRAMGRAGWPNKIAALVGFGLICAFAVIGVHWLLRSDDRTDSVTSPSGSVARSMSTRPMHDEPGSSAASRSSAQETDAKVSSELPKRVGPTNSNVISSPAPIDGDNADQALYGITVSDAGGRERYRIGTATAIGKQSLLTNASVLVAAEKLKAEFPRMFIVSAANRQEVEVSRRLPHPKYSVVYAEIVATRDRLNQLADSSTPTSSTSDDMTTDELAKTRAKVAELSAQMVALDIGKLEIEGQLPYSLKIASAPPPQDQELRLLGLPYAAESLLFTPETTLAVRAVLVRNADKGAALPAGIGDTFHGTFVTEQPNMAWTGSPMLNKHGEVVLLYVRPTRTSLDSAPGVNATDFDASFARRATEF